jgi:hypothetical protein
MKGEVWRTFSAPRRRLELSVENTVGRDTSGDTGERVALFY